MERPRQRQRKRRARDPEAIIRELTDLQVGAPVVHEDYGVGRYRGLTTLDVEGMPTEFLLLEYAGGDKLYVPVLSLHLVTRYSGASPEEAPLHRLGTDQWEKAKRKAAQQARDTAAELLNLYAQRAARQGTELDARRSELSALRAAVSVRGDRGPADRHRSRARRTWRARGRWTASSAATSASARPRSRCARRSSPCRPAIKSRCSCRRRCSRSSTIAPSRTGSPTGPCASSSCRDSAARAARRPPSRGSPQAPSTS